jgi:diguanylate cyclase
MSSVAPEGQWKDKYRDLVREFEDKERTWKALEAALRSATGKLALAAMGQSPEIDAAVDHVVATLRTQPGDATLDSSLSALVRALQLHGNRRRAPSAGVAEDSSSAVVALLRQLVRDLARIGPMADAARALDRRIDAGVPEDGWDSFLRGVADAIGDVVKELQSQRRELEEFLDQVTRQLADFESWSSWQAGAAQTRRDDSIGLERSVQDQVRGINQEVESSVDLISLKVKVQARLNIVAGQLREFRQQEEVRLAENEQRTRELNQEVSKLKSRTDELVKLCAEQEARLMIDTLTGAHSRYAYDRRLGEEFQRWQRHGQPLAFAIFDVDHFKRINDTYGHDAGDRLLRGVADLLNRNKRAEDFLARIGGEEFVLLLPMTTAEAAAGVADKLRETIAAAPFRHHGERVAVTISCGFTEFRKDDTPATVYERADKGLYEAKNQGRNCTVAA